jgi:hypothetical protein
LASISVKDKRPPLPTRVVIVVVMIRAPKESGN